MKKTLLTLAALAALTVPTLADAMPTVYPRGTTIYTPEKCYNGYTLITMMSQYRGKKGPYLIDMNGNVVKTWDNLNGMPNKIFPGGMVSGSTSGKAQEFDNLVLEDWDGNILWELNYNEKKYPKQHHDYQFNGSATGYYSPAEKPAPLEGRVLIDGRAKLDMPEISGRPLDDEYIYEVDVKSKEIVWQWNAASSFDQLDLTPSAKEVIKKQGGNWIHINSVSYVGPNKWWDEDPVKYSMFNPENIIWDGRLINVLGITDRKGNIVWKVGPDYDATPELKMLGQIIGQHHCHMIPKGLPGEGNILVFDNGGECGWGDLHANRACSRVIEFNPVTLEVVWEYNPTGVTDMPNEPTFFSSYISSAQRLPNGNTMIVEGAYSRAFEVTPEKEIVWEYIGPTYKFPNGMTGHTLYRSYRIPYDYIPQLAKPVETAVVPADEMDSRKPYVPADK